MRKRCNRPSQVRSSEGIGFTLFHITLAPFKLVVPVLGGRGRVGRGGACCLPCGGAAPGAWRGAAAPRTVPRCHLDWNYFFEGV